MKLLTENPPSAVKETAFPRGNPGEEPLFLTETLNLAVLFWPNGDPHDFLGLDDLAPGGGHLGILNSFMFKQISSSLFPQTCQFYIIIIINIITVIVLHTKHIPAFRQMWGWTHCGTI